MWIFLAGLGFYLMQRQLVKVNGRKKERGGRGFCGGRENWGCNSLNTCSCCKAVGVLPADLERGAGKKMALVQFRVGGLLVQLFFY